ncbi:TatD family hydrolase [Tepidibacillus fermentans]|uniref:TatD DNase family protein n=1 Tax=Tepidibacillus fermentans TaxID=1281767 RepID=A0A4R3KL29_9BACI|nr:TatD family hydrolase [Tepidibacillus fermentans]TCS84210.1 TatD DNase family protein [Tepidibacillus fermentans]
MNRFPIWDSHIHLNQYPKEKIPYYLEKWENGGVEGIIAVATDLRSSYELLEWKQKYPDFIHIAMGHHPEQELPVEKDLLDLLALIQMESSKIVAIGEVGIIHYRQSELGVNDLNGYIELLKIFTETAKKLNVPIILHAVHDKTEIALQTLLEENMKKAHFHWFKSSKETTKKVIEAGYTVSFTPELTFRERDQMIAKQFPLTQILLETDGPWPLEGNFNGRIPEPIWIRESISTLAKLKKLTEEDIVYVLNQNISHLYLESI